MLYMRTAISWKPSCLSSFYQELNQLPHVLKCTGFNKHSLTFCLCIGQFNSLLIISLKFKSEIFFLRRLKIVYINKCLMAKDYTLFNERFQKVFTSKQGTLDWIVTLSSVDWVNLIILDIMELNCMHFRFFIDEPYTTVLHLQGSQQKAAPGD